MMALDATLATMPLASSHQRQCLRQQLEVGTYNEKAAMRAWELTEEDIIR